MGTLANFQSLPIQQYGQGFMQRPVQRPWELNSFNQRGSAPWWAQSVWNLGQLSSNRFMGINPTNPARNLINQPTNPAQAPQPSTQSGAIQGPSAHLLGDQQQAPMFQGPTAHLYQPEVQLPVNQGPVAHLYQPQDGVLNQTTALSNPTQPAGIQDILRGFGLRSLI